MTRYIIFASFIAIVLFAISYRSSLALFTAGANSTGNTFTAAAVFPTGEVTGIDTPTPTISTTPTETTTPAPGKIVINEVFQSTASDSAEWVELYNSGGSTVDVSGWKITDQTSLNSSEDILPTTPGIPGGSFALIVTQASSVAGIPSSATKITLTGTGSGQIGSGLNASSENVYLKDSSGNIKDQMGYGTANIFGGNLPAAAPSGQSLRRIPNGIDTDIAGNWTAGSPSIGVTN